MADRSPDLSPWEDIGPNSEGDQNLYFNNISNEAPYYSDENWTIVKPERNASAVQPDMAASPAPRRHECGHLAERGCSLNASGECCECSDMRPQSTSGFYDMYIDGQGYVERATRWEYYCQGCKNHKETEVLNQMMERLKQIAAQHEARKQRFAETKCEHWVERGCSMNGRDCCACSDLRPGTKSDLYPAYVDGKGWVADVSRWAHYCPGCKEYDESHVEPNSVLATSSLINGHRDGHIHSAETVTSCAKQCPHFTRRGCSMTATNGQCCACTDRRPHSESGVYSTYIDGKGWVEGSTRSAGYCPNCRLAHDGIAARKHRHAEKKRLHKQRSRRPRVEKHVDFEKTCDHWQQRSCAMTSNPRRCCSCADKRPNAPSYSMYVDGTGWVMGAERWAHYCPGCQEHHKLSVRQSARKRNQTGVKGVDWIINALRTYARRSRREAA